MAIQAARPVRPAAARRPVAGSAVPAQGPAPARAPRPRQAPQAREGLEDLKRWLMARGAMVGAGFGLFFAGVAAFGHPISGLMALGLAAGAMAGAAAGAFVGAQLGDLGIYMSGRLQLKRRGHGADW